MSGRTRLEERDERRRADLDFVEAELRSGGRIAPVGNDPEERRLWLAHDLASLVEGCLHERVDPAALDEPAQAHWRARIGKQFVFSSWESWDNGLLGDERRYWLLDRSERAGTIALGGSAFTGPWLRVGSLYVLPEHRRRGLAGTALEEAARHATRRSLVGIRLGTSWTWQTSLRFYLARGLWVRSWKHDIQLVLEHELPKRIFSLAGDTASLGVIEGGAERLLLTARRDGERLVLETEQRTGRHDELDLYAEGTFAMLLALAGWPLVRSEAHWARRYYSADMGESEGLAYKIGVFEDVARKEGWSVETVPIPGLDRWRAWERGEEHGRREQQLRDLETVLRERGWQVERDLLEKAQKADPYFAFEQLLRNAVTAGSLEEWRREVDKLLVARGR